jgi:hypothetical protein
MERCCASRDERFTPVSPKPSVIAELSSALNERFRPFSSAVVADTFSLKEGSLVVDLGLNARSVGSSDDLVDPERK